MIGRVNTSRPSTKYSIARWCATIGQNYTTLDTIPEVVMRDLMTKYASVAYFMEWYSADSSMIDAFIANQYAMKWIGHRDYICDKLMNYGTINLLKPTLETTTTNGVTCTNNGDGTYTLSGTASSDTQFVIGSCDFNVGEYKVVGCPSGGSVWNSYLLYTIGVGVNGIDVGNGNIFTISESSTKTVAIWLKSGLTYNLRFKPMLTTNLEATYSDFIQYGHSEIGDKMLGSEYWEYILKDHVPVMTSDSAPYGSVTCSENQTEYEAYRAFANDVRGWVPNVSTSSSYIQYNFTNPINVKKMKLFFGNGRGSITFSAKVYGINGSETPALVATINSTTISSLDTVLNINTTNDGYYMSYKVAFDGVLDAGSTGFYSIRLQFFGRSLNVSVPTMISNTSPYGEIFASGEYDSNRSKLKAFDGAVQSSSSMGWLPSPSDTWGNAWIDYLFTSEISLKQVYVSLWNGLGGGTTLRNIQFKMVGVNGDGSTEDISSALNIEYSGIGYYFAISNIKAFKRIRFLLVGTSGSASTTSGSGYKLQFYGVDYSERTDRTYLYDHGLELVPLDYSGYAFDNDYTNYNYWENSSGLLKENTPMTSGMSGNAIGTNAKIDLSQYGRMAVITGSSEYPIIHSELNLSDVNSEAYLVVFKFNTRNLSSIVTRMYASTSKIGGDASPYSLAYESIAPLSQTSELLCVSEWWLE